MCSILIQYEPLLVETLSDDSTKNNTNNMHVFLLEMFD